MLPVTNYHETMHDYFLFFLLMQKLYKYSHLSSFSECVGKALGYNAISFNNKYTSACIPYNVTQKITSFKHMTSSGVKEGWRAAGAQPCV